MDSPVRNSLAVVAGAVVGFALITAIELLNYRLYPPPAGLDLHDTLALKAYAGTLPLTALALVLVGYAVGGFGGGLVTGWVAPSARRRNVWIIVALLLGASLMNLLRIPHPWWFWVANLLLVVATPLAGARLAPGARA